MRGLCIVQLKRGSDTSTGAYSSLGGGWVGGSGSTGGGGHGAFPPLNEVPTEWTCDPPDYDDVGRGNGLIGSACDCECGAFDPDCNYTQLDIANCAEGQTCSETTFTCEGVPTSWLEAGCVATDYSAGLANGCQCDCGGARDPDCDLVGVVESGCADGDFCILSLTGSCYTPVAGWTCDPSLMDNGQCECGCGLLDPDCFDVTVEYCWLCGTLGSCQINPCPGSINPTNNAVCE